MASRIAPKREVCFKKPKKEKKSPKYLKRSFKPIKPGKKTRQWSNARRKCNKDHFENQRTRCENCGSEFGTGNAHRFKRIDIKSQEELLTTVILCVVCHTFAEHLSHEEMKKFLDKLIETRAERYWTAC